jgi:hypothetical protein
MSPRTLAEGAWDGGRCRVDSRGRLSYSYASREVGTHGFGFAEKPWVIGLRCSRWRTSLLTAKYHYGLPGAEDLAKRVAVDPRVRHGMSVSFVMSKIEIVEEWCPVVASVLSARGPILLHGDGTVAAPVDNGRDVSWSGWAIVKGGALRGTQMRGIRGLLLLAVAGEDALRAFRVSRLTGEQFLSLRLHVGSELTSTAGFRPTAGGRACDGACRPRAPGSIAERGRARTRHPPPRGWALRRATAGLRWLSR